MPGILVITAVPAERDAALSTLGVVSVDRSGRYPRYLSDQPAGRVAVTCCGVGPAAAAAGAATLLGLERYDLVVCAGIAGAFRGQAELRQVVLANRIVHADLGADSPSGFLGLHELGFGETEHELGGELVAAVAARVGALVGPVLTVSTATGTDSRAALLAARYAAVAEAMEGAGVYAAARAGDVPMLELRAVSNVVGRRDLRGWDIPGALTALGTALAALVATPLPL
jgi:futalosine hydrolase